MPRPRLPRPALVLLLAALALPAGLRAQTPVVSDTVPEETLVELQLGRLASRTVPAYRQGDDALIPLTQLLDLAELRYSADSDGVLRGVLEPSRRPFSLDPATANLTVGDRVFHLGAGELLRKPADLYVSARRLSEALGLTIDVDWSALEVAVRDPDSLPVAVRIEREQARRALTREGGVATPDLVLGSQQPPVGGLVLDYSVFSPSNNLLGGASYSLAAGTEVGGGSLEVGLQSAGAASSGDVRLDASWLGVFRNQRWLRQVRVGDGLGSGSSPRSIRGLYLSNAPFVRPSLISDMTYGGQLPPGWQLEAYRNGVLVGVDSVQADGRYSVELPVLYGDNPVDFVAYGPYGERREFSRKYLVPSALLPAGRLEYGLSAGQCRLDACSAAANVDLRAGLTRTWTVGAGVDRFWRDSAPDLFHPYLNAIGTLADAWTAEGNFVGQGYARGRLSYEPDLNVRVGSEVTRFAAGSDQSLLNPLHRRTQVLLNAFWRPMPWLGSMYVDSRLDYSTTATGSMLNARTGVSLMVAGIRAVPYVRLQRQGLGDQALTAGFVGFDAYAVPSARWGALFRQLWLRGSYESHGLGTPQLVSFSVARSLTQALRLETGVNWTRGSSGATWTMALTTSLPQFRAYSQVSAPAAGPVSASQMIQGSVVYDGGPGSLGLEAGPVVQRAGIGGQVYLDENGNGRKDPEEAGLGGVAIQVAGRVTRSDSLGYYRVWDIMPFEPALIAVDSLSFESPLWVAAFGTALAYPGPNRLTRVDVPIQLGAVVEGVVQRGETGEAVAGVPLVLVERGSDRRRTATTFSDGTFYSMGITPGTWDVTVAPSALKLLDAQAEPVKLVIAPGATEAPRVLVQVRSRP